MNAPKAAIEPPPAAPPPLPHWPDGLLDSLPVGLLTVDRRLMVRSANAQGRRMLGVRREGASLGRRLLDGLDPQDRQRLREALALPHDAAAGGLSCGEVRFAAADGVPRVLRVEARPHDGQGEAVLACIDVTAARAETDQAVHRADHDALTGLPNRAAILARLDQALQQARAADRRLALMFIDLDRFKTLNDTHGHEAGDRLLREVAQRLRRALGDIGIPSRLGGDEFLVLLPSLDGGADVAALAQRAAQALAEPVELADRCWRPTASIGVSVFPQHGQDAGTLLRRADMALYRVKQQGRDGVLLYDGPVDEPAAPGVEGMAARPSEVVMPGDVTLDELRAAVARHEFELHYQPQRALDTDTLVGMGALLRWQHPERGLVTPPAFIPLAEQSGLISILGNWTLATAARQLRLWHQAGHNTLGLSVKLSPQQLEHDGLASQVGRVLRTTRLPPSRLQLQIPEGALLQAPPQRLALVEALRRHGAGLALDRFGTGPSSLALLSRLRPDCVRIDRTIVGQLPAPEACALVQAIVALSRSLSLQVLAEGVETEAQRQQLAAMGVDLYQGHLTGAPMPAAQATALLKG